MANDRWHGWVWKCGEYTNGFQSGSFDYYSFEPPFRKPVEGRYQKGKWVRVRFVEVKPKGVKRGSKTSRNRAGLRAKGGE